MMLKCDGCGGLNDMERLQCVTDYGHEVRYCSPCRKEYEHFVSSSQAQEVILQRQLDEWINQARQLLPLALTPFDLACSRPRLTQDGVKAGQILG